MKKTIALDIIVFLLVVLFMYTGIYKIFSVEMSFNQMQTSPLIRDYARVFSWGVPIIELIVGGLLIMERTRLKGLYASLILMIAFTSFVIVNLLFKEYSACSCGGVISSMTWTQHLFFNIFFTVLAMIGVVIYSRRREAVAVVV